MTSNPPSAPDNQLAGRVRSSAVWTVVGRFVSTIAVFATHMILARSMPLAEYGSVVAVIAVATLLSRLCPFGMNSLVIRESRVHEQGCDGALFRKSSWSVLATSLIACVGYALATRSGFDVPGAEFLGYVIVWSLAVSFGNFAADILRANDGFFWANALGGQIGGAATNIVQLAAVGWMWKSGLANPENIIALHTATAVVAAVVAIALAAKHFRGNSQPTSDSKIGYWFLMWEAVPILIIDLLVVGHQHIETLILDACLTPESVGMFSGVRRIITLAGFPLILLNTTLRPFIAQLYRQQDEQQLDRLLRGSATAAVLVALPIYAGIALFAEPLLAKLFGPEFVAAAWALRILTVSGIIFVASGCCGMVLLMTGNQRVTMWTILATSIAYLAVAPFALQNFGIVGAAVASALFVIVSNVLLAIASKYFSGIWSTATISPRILRDAWQVFVQRGPRAEGASQ